MFLMIIDEKMKDTDTAEELLEYFKVICNAKPGANRDGKIPNPEFKQIMMNMGSKLPLEDVEKMIKELDPKGEGAIDIEEIS